MSLRLRLVAITLAIYAAGGYLITRWAIQQVRPRYLESMEATLVDTSVLLAGVLEAANTPQLDPALLRDSYALAHRQTFSARVFSLTKTHIDLRVYVTDAAGRVVFDSLGRDEGKDFSRWNDVARTLQGRYGARSTRDLPGDDNTQVIYVAAPVKHDGRIIGVVSVGKPTRGINELVAVAKHRILIGAATGGLLLLVILMAAIAWVVAPLEKLTAYARAVRDGRPATVPELPGHTLHELATAFEQMRDALEGRQHAERYTRALAHEVKAPLAAIRGAAELMDEAMPPDDRRRFLANIRTQGARIQHIVDRLLELSSVEAQKRLASTERLRAADIVAEAADTVRAAFDAANVQLEIEPHATATVNGDRYLLRQALVNFLQNALDFSPSGSVVTLSATVEGGDVVMSVTDDGPGIPEYALPRVFERFYSLPRPAGGQKSTGIGLPLVREIAHLHRGEAEVTNRDPRGARAVLRLPAAMQAGGRT